MIATPGAGWHTVGGGAVGWGVREKVAPRASPFPAAQGSRGAQHAGGMGRGWGTLQAGGPSWSRQHCCLQAAGVWAHGCLHRLPMPAPAWLWTCVQAGGGWGVLHVCVCVRVCACARMHVRIYHHQCVCLGTSPVQAWGQPCVPELGGPSCPGRGHGEGCAVLGHTAMCHAMLDWQSWAGGRRPVAEEAPSILPPPVPSQPGSILSPGLSCILPAWPGSGPAPQWDPCGGREGEPCRRDPVPPCALLPTPNGHRNSRPNSCAAPATPRHGTAQHGTEVGASRPTCQHRIRPSCPPASALTQSPALQVSPGLYPSAGLGGGLGGPLPPGLGVWGGRESPWGGGGEEGWEGDSASGDFVLLDVGRGDGTLSGTGTPVMASLPAWGHWGLCLSVHPGDVSL